MTIISLPTPIQSPSQHQQKQGQQNKKRRFRRTKQKMEYELSEIYRRLCNGETDLQIMTTLCLQERNYYKYKKKLEARIMEYQRNKTVDTIFMESRLFKNRMLTLYKALENQVTSSADKTSGTDKAYIHVLYSGFSSRETKTEELAKQKTSIEKSCHGLPSRVMYIDP